MEDEKRAVTAHYNCISNNTECHRFCSNGSLYKISSESITNTLYKISSESIKSTIEFQN